MRTLRLSLTGMVILALLGGLSGAAMAWGPTEWVHFTIVEDDDLNVVATDPRMSGEWVEGEWVLLAIPSGENFYTSSLRIENEAGAWQGTTAGRQLGFEEWEQVWLVGEGAYEGLSALFVTYSDTSRWPEGQKQGFIFEGDLPLLPDMPEPSAE